MFFVKEFFFLIPEIFFTVALFVLLTFYTVLIRQSQFTLRIDNKLVSGLLSSKSEVLSSFFLISGITVFLLYKLPVNEAVILFQNQIYISPMTQIFKMVSLVTIMLLVYFSATAFNFPYWEEIILLTMFFTLSVLIIISANDLLLFWLASEFQMFSLILLIAQNRHSILAIESAMRVFCYSVFMANVFLFGACAVYEQLGTINLSMAHICMINIQAFELTARPVLTSGILAVLSYFMFKFALFPTFSWLITAAEGSYLLAASFFLIISKLATFPVFIRVFAIFSSYIHNMELIILIIGLFSIAFGTFGALIQTNIKRFLAYNSVSHVGWIILNFAYPTVDSLLFSLFYLFVYTLVSVSFFLILFLFVPGHGHTSFVTITELSHIYSIDTSLAVITIIFLVSSMGFPPLVGFYSKAFVFYGLAEMHAGFTLFLLTVLSAVGAYNYVRLVLLMIAHRRPISIYIMPFSFPKLFIVYIVAIINVTMIAYVHVILNVIQRMVLTSF